MNKKKPDLKKIEVILMDMDGCLTTGHIIYSSSGEDTKMFHTHDGYGLTRAGIRDEVCCNQRYEFRC